LIVSPRERREKREETIKKRKKMKGHKKPLPEMEIYYESLHNTLPGTTIYIAQSSNINQQP
jgi:hypothetical protein